MVSDKLSVGELMTTQMTALEPVMLVSKLETVLKRCAHQAFPITSEVDKAFAASMLLSLCPPKPTCPVSADMFCPNNPAYYSCCALHCRLCMLHTMYINTYIYVYIYSLYIRYIYIYLSYII